MNEKLPYLYSTLTGDTLKGYLIVVQAYDATFQQAIAVVNWEYNSTVRQKGRKNIYQVWVFENLEKQYRDIHQLIKGVRANNQADATSFLISLWEFSLHWVSPQSCFVIQMGSHTPLKGHRSKIFFQQF